MNRTRFLLLAFTSMIALAGNLFAARKTLDVYWMNVEGGAATLIVTPEKESVLIDSGSAGGRDSARIHEAAMKAGLKKIDHFILTHYHTDHFGGIAEVAQMMPVGVVHDKGIPEGDPDHNHDARFPLLLQPYREMKVDQRVLIHPDDLIPLRQSSGKGAGKLALRCLAVDQKLTSAKSTMAIPGDACADAKSKPIDTSDNANSVVMLLEFGGFRMYMAGDLTWNVEARLVCPVNLVGPVDVYQVTHHGLDQSNNPLLIQALSPTVAIMSNGTAKGCEPGTFTMLSTQPSIKAIFQIHRNLRPDAEHNTAPEHIANLEKECAGNYLKLSVAEDGSSYVVSIPATGHEEKFQTRNTIRN